VTHVRSHTQGRGAAPVLLALVVLAALVVLVAACGSSSGSSSASASATPGVLPSPSPGSSITVVYHYPAPPASVLAQFTALTGVKVNWVEVGWDKALPVVAAKLKDYSIVMGAAKRAWDQFHG